MITARLVNDPFGDPAVYVDLRHRKEAFLFDLGDIAALPPRMLLRLDHVFVTHTHMDHFIGFDRLLRICLGREKEIRLYGPPGFIDNVAGKFRAYTWNLVENYANEFRVVVTEIHPDRRETAVFSCRRGFRPEPDRRVDPFDAVILARPAYCARAMFLDHKVPCLAFCLEETRHINVMKNALDEMGLPGGPWLNELKNSIQRNDPEDAPFRIWWKTEGGGRAETLLPLGELVSKVVKITPGRRIAYVSDAVYHAENAGRIVEFVRNADLLFIEACFLEDDSGRAAEKYHLTARQAGRLARESGVKRFVLFHFSPKYRGQEALFMEEAMREFEEGSRV